MSLSPRNQIGRVASTAAIVLALSALSTAAEAQGPSLAALRVGVARLPASDTLRPRYAASGAGGKRVLLSVIGAATGAVAGVALALEVLPQTHCGDDSGWCAALQGLAVGSILGAGLGAALPRGTGACAYRVLAPRALLGSSLGYLVGALVTGDPLVGIVFGGPIGAAAGGAIGARRCRAS